MSKVTPEVKAARKDVKIESRRASKKGGGIENKISAITENLASNIDRMYNAVRAAISAGKVPPDTLDRLQAIMSGKGGMLRIVIDIQRGARLSDANAQQAKQKILDAFAELWKLVGEVSTKIEVVIREAGKKDRNVIDA